MKLSFIMQTYLGDYPGSRDNSIDKFHRAVNSIQSQDSKDWELVIVSDGCKITKDLYYKHYESNPNIKFAYVEKDKDTLMYSTDTNKKYYRGLPRQIGRAIATGDWIGYMDSDDFIVKDGVTKIKDFMSKISEYEKITGKSIKFLFNNRIIEHFNYLAVVKKQLDKHGLQHGVATIESDVFKIDGLPDEWFVRGNYKTFGMGTVFMWHTNDFPPTKWQDIESETISEDILFANSVLENPELKKHIGIMEVPYYVRCHYSKIWDV